MTSRPNQNIKEKNFEYKLENILYKSRWLLSVVYYGLIISLVMLVFAFIPYLVVTFYSLFGWELPFKLHLDDFIFHLLELVDIALIGNLILMVVLFGYQNFVSKINPLEDKDVKDKPRWMNEISYANIKIKVIGSIVAISAIQLLAIFFKISKGIQQEAKAADVQPIIEGVVWLVIVHLTFVFSGLIFAMTEFLLSKVEVKTVHDDDTS